MKLTLIGLLILLAALCYLTEQDRVATRNKTHAAWVKFVKDPASITPEELYLLRDAGVVKP